MGPGARPQYITLVQNAKRRAKVTVSSLITHSALLKQRKISDDVTDIHTTQSQANKIQYTALYANMGT